VDELIVATVTPGTDKSATPATPSGSAPILGACGDGQSRTRARPESAPHAAHAPVVCHQLPAPGTHWVRYSPVASTSWPHLLEPERAAARVRRPDRSRSTCLCNTGPTSP